MKKNILLLILISICCSVNSQVPNRIYIGMGYNLVFTEKLKTNIELRNGSNATQEATLSGSASGLNIDWIKFYVNNRLVFDVSSNLAFLKHKILNAANIDYKGSAKLCTSSVLIRYNFVSKTYQDNSVFNTYIGLGPGITKFKNLSATAEDNAGNSRYVNLTYSNYVPCISSKIGFEYLMKPQKWANHWISFSADIRSSIALKKQNVINTLEKQNGSVFQSNPDDWDQVNPSNFALVIGASIGL